MSSHHVVRDNQEPALLILNQTIDANALGELLEWGGSLWIDENLLDWAESDRIKPDGVILHSPHAPKTLPFPDLVLIHATNHAASKIESLQKKTGSQKVQVFTNDGMELLMAIYSSGKKNMEVSILDNTYRYFMTAPAGAFHLQEKYPESFAGCCSGVHVHFEKIPEEIRFSQAAVWVRMLWR